MKQKQTVPHASEMKLADVYYVLYRHKLLIAITSLLGVIGVVVLYFVWAPPYQSEAKLLVRYVTEGRSPSQEAASTARVKSPDERGDNIINSEIEILTSLDLAQEVADTVGPEKILAMAGGGTNRIQAAVIINQNIFPDVPKKSDVICLTFRHPDRNVVQLVLTQLIDAYRKKHGEIHSGGMFDNFLTRQTDDLRTTLEGTEQDLAKKKAEVGIFSVEESKKDYSEQKMGIQREYMLTQAELAEHQAAVTEMQKQIAAKMGATANAASTNVVAATNNATVPPDKIADYQRVCRLLTAMEAQEQILLAKYTTENIEVKSLEERLTKAQAQKKALEDSNPGLIALKPVDGRIPFDNSPDPRAALSAEITRVVGLEAKVRTLTNQLEKIHSEMASIEAVEGSITELQRKKELEEGQYNYFYRNLEQSKIDESVGPGRVNNISTIQEPSPPMRDLKPAYKIVAGLLFGGVLLGIALAFLSEFYLDRTIKRPVDIESKLHLPLFINIPRIHLNGKARALKKPKKVLLLPQNGDAVAAPAPEGQAMEAAANGKTTNGEVAPWDSKHVLQPFFEALRDQVMMDFEVRDLKHKPKLVAVTSCNSGAGVTTTAAGLAASLSETGDGNVLLVDLNLQNGDAHRFYKGKLTCGLDEAFNQENGKRNTALIQDNLYYASESGNGDKLPRILPKRFNSLVPKMRASDYDYIIFDMPPVTQISVTSKLARYMDTVLMVVEAEKTDRDVVRKATTVLEEANAHVGVVLNKSQSHLPRRLQQDI